MFIHYFTKRLITTISCFFITPNIWAEADLHFPFPFQPEDLTPSQTDFGGVGLIQMPSARMSKDGEFSIGYNQNSEYQFYSISLQLMPWLETTLRYTQVEDVLYSPNPENFSGDTKYTDKGIDAKLRLLKESHWLPEIAVGLRDLGGTGLFDGEFVAATKRFYTNDYGQFDVTLGLGWGYLGQQDNIENPLCSVSSAFCNRSSTFLGNGGSIDYARWFTGTTSIYGGIEYQTPYRPLTLKLEYDGNDYTQDFPVTRSGVDMTPDSPWNIGAVYSLSDNFRLRASYERGTTLSFGFTFNTNFDTIKSPWLDDPIPPLDTNQANTLYDINWSALDTELETISGYKIEKAYVEENTVSIVADQSKYRDRNVAAERAAAVLNNHLPTNIDTYKIVEKKKSIPVNATEIDAQDYRDVARVNHLNPDMNDALTVLPAEDIEGEPLYDTFEPFNASFSPNLSQSLGNPESFYIYSLTLNGNASYWLNPHLELSSTISMNLVNNLDELIFDVPTDHTSNYRVRTLTRAYVRENEAYLHNLQLTWFQKYNSNWYQQIYGGYLESIFAGVGGEFLYRRPNSSWAIGADFNVISQRDPDTIFDTFSHDYSYSDDVKVLSRGTTGHLSLYYQSDSEILEGLRFQLDIGKFLAADKGARIDVSKRYKSGVIIGAYASLTDLSAEEFGEGSFTKGFYFSIPFDTVSLKPTTSRGSLHWQPLTRDGGQVLGKKYNLISITDMVSPWYQKPNQN